MESTRERSSMRKLLRSLPVAAALGASLVIAGCGSSSSTTTSASQRQHFEHRRQERGRGHAPRGRRRGRQPRPRLLVLPDRLHRSRPADPARAVRVQAAGHQPTARSRDRPADRHQRRQDDDDPHPQRRPLQRAAREPDRRRRGHQVRDGAVLCGERRQRIRVHATSRIIVGAPSKPAPTVPNVSGIQAPNPTTLVIKTTVPQGVLTVPNALVAPLHRAGAAGATRRSSTRARLRPTACTRCSPART